MKRLQPGQSCRKEWEMGKKQVARKWKAGKWDEMGRAGSKKKGA